MTNVDVLTQTKPGDTQADASAAPEKAKVSLFDKLTERERAIAVFISLAAIFVVTLASGIAFALGRAEGWADGKERIIRIITIDYEGKERIHDVADPNSIR